MKIKNHRLCLAETLRSLGWSTHIPGFTCLISQEKEAASSHQARYGKTFNYSLQMSCFLNPQAVLTLSLPSYLAPNSTALLPDSPSNLSSWLHSPAPASTHRETPEGNSIGGWAEQLSNDCPLPQVWTGQGRVLSQVPRGLLLIASGSSGNEKNLVCSLVHFF